MNNHARDGQPELVFIINIIKCVSTQGKLMVSLKSEK